MKTTKISRVAQAISGFSLLAVALTVGLTGMKLNIDNGLKTGVEAAVIFAAADAARMILPLVCGVLGWTKQMKAVALVCVAASLFCAVTAFLSGADQHRAEKQAAADHYAAIQADVVKADDRVRSLDTQVVDEGKNKGCKSICQALQREAAQARTELAAAKAKAETVHPVAVSSGETLETRIKAFLLLLIVESTVWLSIPAMTCLRSAFTGPKPTVRKKRTTAKPKKIKVADKTNVIELAPRLTKAGNIDRRSKAARAVKRVVGTKVLA